MCAVYIQQTFQVAGLTLLIPKDQIEVIDVKAEDAMKFILSGGMTSKKEKQGLKTNPLSTNDNEDNSEKSNLILQPYLHRILIRMR